MGDFRDQELPLVEGCVYVTGVGHVGKVPFKIWCHKITAPGSQYCPKHKVYAEELAEEQERKRQEKRRQRFYDQTEEGALAYSPLRAENPDFEDKKKTGYEK